MIQLQVWTLFVPSDSPFHCAHAAWDSYRERCSSGPSSQRNSPPSCTGLDLEERRSHNKVSDVHLCFSVLLQNSRFRFIHIHDNQTPCGRRNLYLLTVFLRSLQKGPNGSEIAFMSQEQGLNFALKQQQKERLGWLRANLCEWETGNNPTPKIELQQDVFLRQRAQRHCLGEEVDTVGDCVHGDRVSSNEESSKVHSGQLVELGVQTGQLPNVVADHMQ